MSAGDPYDAKAIARMAADVALTRTARDFVIGSGRHRYAYNFSWLGRPIIQYPQDIMALQEIVWRVKPERIIETGVAHGGSTVFFASMLELIGGAGRVIAIDIEIRPHNRVAIEAHPMSRRVTLIEGSSIDDAIAERVRREVEGAGPIMVVLDSNHTCAHVSRELELYAPLVSRGSYVVVMDTVVEYMPEDSFPDRPWSRGDNPLTAVERFLARDDRFAVDSEMENKLLVTVAPGGYLRRVKD